MCHQSSNFYPFTVFYRLLLMKLPSFTGSMGNIYKLNLIGHDIFPTCLLWLPRLCERLLNCPIRIDLKAPLTNPYVLRRDCTHQRRYLSGPQSLPVPQPKKPLRFLLESHIQCTRYFIETTLANIYISHYLFVCLSVNCSAEWRHLGTRVRSRN